MKNAFIIVIIAAILLGGGYYAYTKRGDDGSTLSVTTGSGLLLSDVANNDDTARAARILSLLNQVRSLKIDLTLFQSQAYRSLIDRTVSIPPQDVGRDNPFAPIRGEAVAPTQGGATGGTGQTGGSGR